MGKRKHRPKPVVPKGFFLTPVAISLSRSPPSTDCEERRGSGPEQWEIPCETVSVGGSVACSALGAAFGRFFVGGDL